MGIFSLDWMTYYDLARRGIPTQARVTAKEPENHRFIRYSYSVDEGVYSGFGVAGNGNPDFDDISVGDSVTVYYEPDIPNVSFLGDPKYQLSSVTRGVIFITFTIPAFVLFAMSEGEIRGRLIFLEMTCIRYHRRRRRRIQPSNMVSSYIADHSSLLIQPAAKPQL